MLSQNQLLVDITREISGKEPDRDEIAARLRDHPMVQGGRYDGYNLFSVWSEIHLRVLLEHACDELNVNGRVEFDPIKDGESTDNYFFRHLHGNLVVDKMNGDTHCAMDQLLVIDGIPTVFEVSLSGKWGLSKHLKHLMSEGRITHVLDPLKEYFRSEEYGYSVVTNGNKIKPHLSPEQADFKERGGILIPSYLDSHERDGEVKRIREDTRL